MYVLVRAGLYPGLPVYCLLLTASPVLQSICSGVREILFCTSVLVEQRVCVHPRFVLYCIVYYKRERERVCVYSVDHEHAHIKRLEKVDVASPKTGSRLLGRPQGSTLDNCPETTGH